MQFPHNIQNENVFHHLQSGTNLRKNEQLKVIKAIRWNIHTHT